MARFSILLCIALLTIVQRLPASAQTNDTTIVVARRASEVTIALNPLDPLNLIAGANLNNYYASTDGGTTWTAGQLASTFGVWGDPCLCFGTDGKGYYVHLSNPPDSGKWIDRIVVARSQDGGIIWDNGTAVGLHGSAQQDKAWLVADMTNSPHRGNLYMAWTEFDKYHSSNPADSSRIRFSHSTDNGATWAPPVVISVKSGNCMDSDSTDEGAVPAVGPDGNVYVAWSDAAGIEFTLSTDGGATFAASSFVATQPGGWDFDVPGLQRCNGMPMLLCDDGDSPYRGTLYLVWSDQRNGADNTDVFLVTSTDGGITWSAVRKVNTDSSRRHQFFPAAALDRNTGNVYVVFYDRRNTAGNATDVYLARSTDGGETFQNIRISDSSFTPSSNNFLGDYIGVAAANGKIYPIWTRQDSVNQTILVGVVRDSANALAVAQVRAVPTAPVLYQNYPNPFHGSTTISFSLPSESAVSLKVCDSSGRIVATLLSGNYTAGSYDVKWRESLLPAGVYYCHMNAGTFTAVKKLTIVK